MMAYRTQTNKDVDHLQPPQDMHAERAVLGAVLKDSEALGYVLETFDTATTFYTERHRLIFQAAVDLYNSNQPCDITTVANEMRKQGNLEKAGGRVYLVELAEGVASTANIESHAGIVLEKSLLRQLISTTNEITRTSYREERPVEDLLDEAESNIFRIAQQRIRQGFLPIRKLVGDTLEHIGEMDVSDGGLLGLPTGFGELDKLTLGLHGGDLIIIAGRPSMGKTSLAMNIAEHIATSTKKGVGMFSVEMSKEQLVLRLLCGRARLNQHRLRSGRLREDEWPSLTTAGNILSQAPLFVDDSPTLTTLQMRAKARRLKSNHDVSLIIVDYIQLMAASGRYENRQQEIATISRGIKALAKELSIPVIAISQLSRQVEQRGGDRIPQLSDLRESGAIEQDADVVMFVHRPEFYMSREERMEDTAKGPRDTKVGKANIIVAKQRNGPTGKVELAFVKELTRFEELAPEYRSAGHDVPEDHDEPSGHGPLPF